MTQRTRRIDELLRQEITAILGRDVADPRIGFVTVTDVETAPDLRHARVWVSIIGPRAQRDETLAALNRAMSFVRRELGTRLHLRRIPEFHVRLDDTAERGTRVLQILHELEEGHVPTDEPTATESLPTPVPRLPRAGDSATDRDSVRSDEPAGRDTRRAKPARGRRDAEQASGSRHRRGR